MTTEASEAIADRVADVLGVDPEHVMIEGRSGRLSLRPCDVAALLALVEAPSLNCSNAVR